MKSFKRSHKNAQISVFVLIAIIVITLLIFLIVTSGDEVSDSIKDSVQDSTRSSLNALNIHEAGARCLELSTQKALLVASLRGGAIYPNESFIQPTFSLDLSSVVSQEYVTNPGLDYSSLQKYMFPGLTNKNYLSRLQREDIEYDLEHFILRDYIECHESSLPRDALSSVSLGYTRLNQTNRRLLSDGTYGYSVEFLPLNEGNRFMILREDGSRDFSRNISEQDIRNSEIRLDIAYNLSEKIFLINTQTNVVETELEPQQFTISIGTTNFFNSSNSDLDTTQVSYSIQTPMYSLIQDMNLLLTAKMLDRGIDFNNQTRLNEFSFQNNLRITSHYLKNESEEVVQLIEFESVDTGSIQVFPYLFSIYSNTNPTIDETFFTIQSSNPINLGTNSLFFNGKIFHDELEDNFLHTPKFEEFSDSVLTLSSNGDVTFHVTTGLYARTLYVTDSELSTPFELVIDLGGDLNEDNKEVASCFEVTYDLGLRDPGYDQINTEISSTSREVSLYNKANLVTERLDWAGLVSAGSSGNVQVRIDKKAICFDSSENVRLYIPAEGVSNQVLPYTFTLDKTQQKDVEIRVFDSSGDELTSPNGLGENRFTFTVAGTDCLGPLQVSTVNGVGSCCDMDRLNSFINNDNLASLMSSEFILPFGTLGYENPSSFLCVNTPRATRLSDWSNISFLKTQQIETNARVTCQGTSPILKENSIQTTGSIFLDTYTISGTSNTVDVYYTPSSVFFNTCRECEIDNSSSSIILERGSSVISLGASVQQHAIDGTFLSTFTQDEINPLGICSRVTYDKICQDGNALNIETSRTTC